MIQFSGIMCRLMLINLHQAYCHTLDYRVKLSIKFYKLAIRNAYISFEDKLSDELYLHFEHKNAPDFWKTWCGKFRKNVTERVNINGKVNDTDVANKFALHFENFL